MPRSVALPSLTFCLVALLLTSQHGGVEGVTGNSGGGADAGFLQALRCGTIFKHQYNFDAAALKAAIGPNCQPKSYKALPCCNDSTLSYSTPLKVVEWFRWVPTIPRVISNKEEK
eukprot:jgi/Chrzof1/6337/Cz18g04220.t1